MIHLITGGERSGKSHYAMKLALKNSKNPTYIATARRWDSDFDNRIHRHQSERGSAWNNLEIEKYISRLNLKGQTVVVDCITLWLTNLYSDNQYQLNATLQEAKTEFDKWRTLEADFFIVSNEIGMGLHAENIIGRKFVELQGWLNQHIAAQADAVSFMVAGLPLRVK
ncbi:MAG: bifunctional adenosylcobinamide kinase/adenosylcobinamide-phosphate guanylyltransferase [Saprospiraceae bacterium]|nr:bifunctional adenosylcobinamide kinase/adenosylcobinamide-phosphate guanylyltransferase [Saprospiraceae bacterium]